MRMAVMLEALFFKVMVLVLMIEAVIFSFNSQNEIEITGQIQLCGSQGGILE